MGYYSFNRLWRDGGLSWPCWLTDSGRFTHKVVKQPSFSLAQDRESSPASFQFVINLNIFFFLFFILFIVFLYFFFDFVCVCIVGFYVFFCVWLYIVCLFVLLPQWRNRVFIIRFLMFIVVCARNYYGDDLKLHRALLCTAFYRQWWTVQASSRRRGIINSSTTSAAVRRLRRCVGCVIPAAANRRRSVDSRHSRSAAYSNMRWCKCTTFLVVTVFWKKHAAILSWSRWEKSHV